MSRSTGAEPRYASINDRESHAPETCMEQPGLEVSPQQQNHAPDSSGLEVTKAPYEHYQDPGKEAVSSGNNEKFLVVEDHAEHKCECAFAAGAGVGALMAVADRKKRASRDDMDATVEPSGTSVPTSTTISTTKSLSIKQGSPLTVTGWHNGRRTEIFLFYLNTDNMIQRSASTATSTNKPSWEAIDEYPSSVSGSSHLSGTTIQYSDGYNPQIELFYTTEDKHLVGLSLNNDTSPPYKEDSIKDMLLATGAGGSVSAYWPWATFQGSDGGLWEVRNRLGNEFSPASEWDAKKLDIVAADASRLALVPLATSFSKIAAKGGYGIVYQDEDNRLAVVVPDFKFNSDELASDYAASWPTDFLYVTLPDQGVFAAFSVARPSDSLGRVNTYILYRDASSDINVVYTEDSSSWLISRPSALESVDPDTDIACLTMATTYRDSIQKEVTLVDDSSLARCYFQKGGLVREVTFDGSMWVDVGNVPVS